MRRRHFAAVLTALAAPAVAAPGAVFRTGYFRAGPGPQFAVLDEIPAKGQVVVRSCNGGWCRVTWRGTGGYVPAELLHGPDIHAGPPAGDYRSCISEAVSGAGGIERVRICSR